MWAALSMGAIILMTVCDPNTSAVIIALHELEL